MIDKVTIVVSLL